MDTLIVTVEAVLQLALMAGLGFLMAKLGVLNKEGTDGLALLLVKLLLPVMLFSSFLVEKTPETTKGILQTIPITIIGSLVGYGLQFLLIKRKDNPVWKEEYFCCAWLNTGFVAMPIISLLLGEMGVLYNSGHISVSCFLTWPVILIVENGKLDSSAVKKIATNICIWASVFGLMVYASGITLPSVIVSPLKAISACSTPVSMLVIGATMSRSKIGELFRNKHFYEVAIFRLIIHPLVAIPIIKLLQLPEEIALAMLIAYSCPPASSCVSLSIQYKKDENFTSGTVALSTALCAITIPVMVGIYTFLF